MACASCIYISFIHLTDRPIHPFIPRPTTPHTQVSDRTFKGMLDHKMGGKTILPGMFFVEMALEASNAFPVTLANVEFKSMLRIPVASKGEQPLLVGLNFKDVKVRPCYCRSMHAHLVLSHDPAAPQLIHPPITPPPTHRTRSAPSR
jgi:hypothetical protein